MKQFVLTGFLLILCLLNSCKKETILENQVIYSSSQKGNDSSNQKTVKVNVVHNGHTININENALMTHLNHGDKLGTVEQNITYQAFIKEENELQFNNPLYIAFRNSKGFLDYNESIFGQLDLTKAKIYKGAFDRQVIGIPSKLSKGDNVIMMLGFVSPDETEFVALVGEENMRTNSVENIGGLMVGKSSGFFSYSSTQGDLLVKVTADDNLIQNVVINPDPNLPRFESCFDNCYASASTACGSSFGCSLACALIGEIPCIVGRALCCAGNCGFGTGDPCS